MRNGVVCEKSEHNALVSIIVPVYNVEKYLDECIQGVLNQTFTDWELLLIDDGSSDNSSRICDDYSAQDDRIKSIHKKNEGVSVTRNIGLDSANAKYIIFLDADDFWYDFTFLEKLVGLADTNHLDIIRGEYKAVDENGKDLFIRTPTKQRISYSERVLDSATFLEESICGEFFGVLFLIRKSAIGNIRFNTQQIFLEDMRFLVTLLSRSHRCMYIPLHFYAYRKIESSVSSQANIAKLKDAFGMCDFFNTLAQSTDDSDLHIYFRRYSIMMYYWTLDTVSMDPYYYNRKNIIKQLELVGLMCRVNKWSESYKGTIPVVIRIMPNIAVVLLRFKHSIGRSLRTLLAKIK